MKLQEQPCNGLTLLSKKQHDKDDNNVASACERHWKLVMRKPQERHGNGLTLRSKKQHDTDDNEVVSACERKSRSHRSGKVAVSHKSA